MPEQHNSQIFLIELIEQKVLFRVFNQVFEKEANLKLLLEIRRNLLGLFALGRFKVNVVRSECRLHRSF
jgi:CRISPR/Cas system-associated endoribonuclease Cas2